MGPFRTAATAVLGIAMLALVIVRPRGWSEAWWTVSAAALALALGLVSPASALDVVVGGRSALLFLLALLLLAWLVGKSGFFEWAAIRCARAARGDTRALYRNTFVLGALITATLSLDTTAVMLTPVVLALVRRLKLEALPHVVLCAMVANVSSLLFPVSNLTNILFADAFHFTFPRFVVRTAVPQLVALILLHALLFRWFRAELPPRFDDDRMPDAASAIPSRTYFRICAVTLVLALVGYFVAPLLGVAQWAVAFGACVILAIAGVATGRVKLRGVREIAWDVFPFVIGLFITFRAVDDLGLVDVVARGVQKLPAGSLERASSIATGAMVTSNLMNNLPAALLARSVLVAADATPADAVAALIGCDIGPIALPSGSLATMLVLLIARRSGAIVPTKRVVGFGVVAAIVLVPAATLTAFATTRVIATIAGG